MSCPTCEKRNRLRKHCAHPQCDWAVCIDCEPEKFTVFDIRNPERSFNSPNVQ